MTSGNSTHTDDQLHDWAEDLVAQLLRAAATAGVYTETWTDGPKHGVTCKTCRDDVVVIDQNELPRTGRGVPEVDWAHHSARSGQCNSDECQVQHDEHANYKPTGRSGVNATTGETYEVWMCQCGRKTMEVFPHLMPGAQ